VISSNYRYSPEPGISLLNLPNLASLLDPRAQPCLPSQMSVPSEI
jgi:hypothetical protein